MVKLLGMLLVASSLLALIAGAFIDARYVSASSVTGNLVLNIVAHPTVNTSPAYYLEAIVFSYSIVSLIMGLVFIFRF